MERTIIKQSARALGILYILSSCFGSLAQEISQELVQEKSPKNKVALIFGVTGQDGSYLAEFLLAKNYDVYGVARRSSSHNTERIDHLLHDLDKTDSHMHIREGDVADPLSVYQIMKETEPDEVYNLAAQSHVQSSFSQAAYTAQATGLGALYILEAIHALWWDNDAKRLKKDVRFYQASTSELYGRSQERPQKETTPFYPRSPYAVAKLYAYWITVNYRESYGIYACNGILFNHESPRRGENFVTRKITLALAQRLCGKKNVLKLGNLDSYRDWGFAGDYVEAMWLMLQQDKPEDYVIATGETHTVREFVEAAYNHAGIKITWQGSGIDEVGRNAETGELLVKVSAKYFRPAEVDYLLGDSSKARQELGWQPKVTFSELVNSMVDADKAGLCGTE